MQISFHEVLFANNMEHHNLHPGPWLRIEGLEVLLCVSILVQDLGGHCEVQDDSAGLVDQVGPGQSRGNLVVIAIPVVEDEAAFEDLTEDLPEEVLLDVAKVRDCPPPPPPFQFPALFAAPSL